MIRKVCLSHSFSYLTLISQIEEEKAEYEEALKLGPKIPASTEPDLGMRVLLVHGDEVRYTPILHEPHVVYQGRFRCSVKLLVYGQQGRSQHDCRRTHWGNMHSLLLWEEGLGGREGFL
jgi:hypothetical protein